VKVQLPAETEKHIPRAPTVQEVSHALNLNIVGEQATSPTSNGGCLSGSYVPVYNEPVHFETAAEIHERFRHVVPAIIQHVETEERQLNISEPKGDVVIVTHAAGLICAVRALMGEAHNRMEVTAGVASFVRAAEVEVENSPTTTGNSQWCIEINGETSHLSHLGGLLYNWGYSGEFAAVPSQTPTAVDLKQPNGSSLVLSRQSVMNKEGNTHDQDIGTNGPTFTYVPRGNL
jgi:hypothetical protein